MKQNHKQIGLTVFITSLVLFGLYFGYASAAQLTVTKQFEGVWKPVKFLEADYSTGELKEIPLTEALGGNGANYLHFKGNKVCTDGFLDGSQKKLCSDASTGDAIFREFFNVPLTRGGMQINVWADDEKTYTIPIELEITNGKLKETVGNGSEKLYEKVKNTVSTAKKTKAKKKTSLTSKLQGKWRVVDTDGSGSEEDIFEITFKGNKYCDSRLKDVIDETKVFCEPIVTKTDGTFTGSRLEAFGGYMKVTGSKLEFYEGGKELMKFVLKKQK